MWIFEQQSELLQICSKLASKLADIDGVVSVNAGDANVLTD